jgi:hypothetical protein
MTKSVGKGTGMKVLIEQVCTNKETLIMLFEEMFGKEQPSDMVAQGKQTGSLGDKIRAESS